MIGFNSAAALVARGSISSIEMAMTKYVCGDATVRNYAEAVSDASEKVKRQVKELEDHLKMGLMQRQVAAQQAYTRDMAYFRSYEAQIIKQRVRLVEMIALADATDFPMQLHNEARGLRKQFHLHLSNLTVPPMPVRKSGAKWHSERADMLMKALETADEAAQFAIDRVDQALLDREKLRDWMEALSVRVANTRRVIGHSTVLLSKDNPNNYCVVRHAHRSSHVAVRNNKGLHLTLNHNELHNYNVGTHYA